MENDYKVADINLAEFGRREISLAENEMPALMALRDKYRDEQPLAGAKNNGMHTHDNPNSCLNGNSCRPWS